MVPRGNGRRPGKAARRTPTAATIDAARWVLGTRPRMTPLLSPRRWLAGAVPDVGRAHRSLRPTAALSACRPGRSAAARRAGVASAAGSAPLPTAHFLLLTAYWLLAIGYWLLAIRHPPLPNLSTPANPVPYCPRSASSRACFEGVLVRRRNRTVRESLRSRAAHSGMGSACLAARSGYCQQARIGSEDTSPKTRLGPRENPSEWGGSGPPE